MWGPAGGRPRGPPSLAHVAPGGPPGGLSRAMDVGDAAPAVESREGDAACAAVAAEVARLCRDGWPVGHTWSAIAVPIVWAAAGRGSLRGLHVYPAVADAARVLRAGLHAHGVDRAEGLAAWASRSCGPFGPQRPMQPFQYFPGHVQEWILHTTGAGPALQVAVLDAVRGPGPQDRGRPGDAGQAGTPSRPCPICYENLDSASTVLWPGGCGHALRSSCLAAFVAHGHGSECCPVCAIDSAGYPRPFACPHGHYVRCGQECGERCPHNLWSGLMGCYICWPAGTGAAPEDPAPACAVDPRRPLAWRHIPPDSVCTPLRANCVMLLDAKRAFLCGSMRRTAYVELLWSDTRYGDGMSMGLLKKAVCGSRDAPPRHARAR